MLTLDHLTVGHGGVALIRDASCRMAEGRVITLLGRNGAGKSTLLRVMSGIDKPMAGSVAIDGRSLSARTARRLARVISLVTTERVRPQGLSCRDVVALGRAPYTNWAGRLSRADEAIVEASLATVGMTAYAARQMDTLSDGECQRIMIARAIAQDTPVIMLDEPTSFLDLPNRHGLARLMASLAHDRGKCVIYSTHELDIALLFSDTVALIDGTHLSCLPAGEMLASPRLAAAFATDGFDMTAYLDTLRKQRTAMAAADARRDI